MPLNEAYAEVADLACPVADEALAAKLLLRASRMVNALCGGDPADLDAARDVVCAMVERAMPTYGEGWFGATQASVTAGPYSQSYTFGGGAGALSLTKSERRMLGIAGAGCGSAAPGRGAAMISGETVTVVSYV